MGFSRTCEQQHVRRLAHSHIMYHYFLQQLILGNALLGNECDASCLYLHVPDCRVLHCWQHDVQPVQPGRLAAGAQSSHPTWLCNSTPTNTEVMWFAVRLSPAASCCRVCGGVRGNSACMFA